MDITSIRYINMARNWDRSLFMRLLLKSVPYKVVRCPGVRFDASNNKYDKYLKYDVSANLKGEDKHRCNGVIGCWIAHSRALESIKEREGVTVILEDDFVCKNNFFDDALKMLNSFDKDFDIIVFDPSGKGPFGMHKVAENIYSPHRYSYPFYYGSHCLFVRNDRIPKILETKLNSQITDYDGWVLCDTRIDSYVFYTGACAVRFTGSDITPGFKKRYELPDMLMCLLPHTLREKSWRFSRYFYEREEKHVSLAEQELAAFEGCYRYSEQSHMMIRMISKNSRSMLMVSWDDQNEVIHPMSEVDFLAERFPIDIKFTKAENGKISAVLIDNKFLFQKTGSGRV